MPRLLDLARGLTLAGLLATTAAMPALADVAPPLPPPPLAPPTLSDSETVDGDWALEVYKLPGQGGALCVISRNFPDGDRLGFVIGHRGRGLLYGAPALQVKDGTNLDFGFSVDDRPPLGIPGQPYDPNTIMTVAMPSPEGKKLFEVFARGKAATIGSNALKFRSAPLSLAGVTSALKALDGCASENNIQEVVVATPAPGGPAAPPPGAAVSGSTFDSGSGGSDRTLDDIAVPGQSGAAVPPPAPGAQAAVTPLPAPAAPAPAPAAPQSAADKAIQDAVSAEAKKRKAGVGYAVAMPKEVTGDSLDDIVLLFVLLEGKERKGYATVIKSTGPDKFTRLNTIALGGVPTNDPPVFTTTGMIVSLATDDPAKTREVEVLINAKELKLKK